MKYSQGFVLENKMIDSHCHINDPLYRDNPEQYVKEAKEAGVDTLLVIGYDLESSKKAAEIASNYDGVFAAVGIHPTDTKKMGPNDFEEIEKLLSNKKVIAIGEIGLDFYWDKDPEIKENQKRYFKQQIELANKYNLPISIHSREADEATLNVLLETPPIAGGVMHCYAGSKEMMPRFLELGLLVGIGGVVTFKNAIKTKEVAKHVSSNGYVLETDAPYLAPTPHRGTPNHSKYIPLIAQEIANLRGEDIEKVIEDSTNNFKRIFKI